MFIALVPVSTPTSSCPLKKKNKAGWVDTGSIVVLWISELRCL